MNWIGLQTFVWAEVQRFMRVATQTLLSPWINAALYIFIFGFVIGSQINQVSGISYIEFVLPGIIMLNIISSSFFQTSFSLYFKRFARYIEELLVAPLSYTEIILGFIIAGVLRGIIVGSGVYIIALLFGSAQIVHLGWFIFYSLTVSIIFSLIGILVALWADDFEQLSVLNTFIITPLTFLGGVFNSITMLPPVLQKISLFNPFFYFVDGFRYSMIGVREANMIVGVILIISLIVSLSSLVWYLFYKGWKLRT